MQNGDEASPSIILAGPALLAKMLITVEPHGIFGSNCVHIYVFYHCQATGMKKGNEASPSIILAGQALLVKMLINLEPHGILGSNFVNLCILTLSSHWYEKR